MFQTIKLNKKEIDNIIINNTLYHSNSTIIISEHALECIKKEARYAVSELKHAINGTYIFLCQDQSAILYGLYKGEDSKIYLVKSFMETVISVVKFERKILYKNDT